MQNFLKKRLAFLKKLCYYSQAVTEMVTGSDMAA